MSSVVLLNCVVLPNDSNPRERREKRKRHIFFLVYVYYYYFPSAVCQFCWTLELEKGDEKQSRIKDAG